MTTGDINLADLLLLFIYLEVLGMAYAYYSTHSVPVDTSRIDCNHWNYPINPAQQRLRANQAYVRSRRCITPRGCLRRFELVCQ